MHTTVPEYDYRALRAPREETERWGMSPRDVELVARFRAEDVSADETLRPIADPERNRLRWLLELDKKLEEARYPHLLNATERGLIDDRLLSRSTDYDALAEELGVHPTTIGRLSNTRTDS